MAADRLAPPDLRAFSGRGIRILVVDSGLVDHPLFEGCPPSTFGLEAGLDVPWTVAPEPAKDMYGHGTAVCGLIRAGAPGAGLASLRVLGTDLRAHSPRVLHALRWGIAQGFDLINCSFGSASLQHLPEYKALVDLAFVANVWLVAAANPAGANPEYPANFPTVFGVRAAEFKDPLALGRVLGDVVEFEARGIEVQVAWKDGATRIVSGSSLAAPHLCAQLARLREARPDLNACEAKAMMYGWALTSHA